jgi:diketogulonate reductase-like aldo/keto reductase
LAADKELNPFIRPRELLEYCAQHDIRVMGYRTMMMKSAAAVLGDGAIRAIAAKHRKSPFQICNRWAMQCCNAILLPKSSNRARIAENADLFDFELDAEDERALNALLSPAAQLAWMTDVYAKGCNMDVYNRL